MKVFGSISVFAVAAIGLAVGQPPIWGLDRTFGKQAPAARQLVDVKPPVDRQDDPTQAAAILAAILDALDPLACGPPPSYFNDPWVNVLARESAKRWALGCVNLPRTAARGSQEAGPF